MPPPKFFQHLGLFVQAGFLDNSICAQIQEQMLEAESRKALISRKNETGGVLDESTRKVLCVEIGESTGALIRQRLSDLKPRLEAHFGIPLTGYQGPDFLRYGEGAFYGVHRDADSHAPTNIIGRRISAVIFLNSTSKEPVTNCYGGGALTFYGLLDGNEWSKCGFSLDAEPGLLIAFHSNTPHEVQPVKFGQRLTVVAWFTNNG